MDYEVYIVDLIWESVSGWEPRKCQERNGRLWLDRKYSTFWKILLWGRSANRVNIKWIDEEYQWNRHSSL